MRRLSKPGRPAPPLDEATTLLLLLGHGAPVPALRRLQFTGDGNIRRVADLWRQNEAFLLREAKRRRIERQHDPDVGGPAHFGEYAVWLVAKCPERYGG